MVALLTAFIALACASAPQQQAVTMNHFIADDKIASVKICQTTGQELLKSFGTPSGQGRDGDMATVHWSSLAMITGPGEATMGTQMILAWIDADGLVAGFSVNTMGIPQRPEPCHGPKGGLPVESDPTPPVAPEPIHKKPNDA